MNIKTGDEMLYNGKVVTVKEVLKGNSEVPDTADIYIPGTGIIEVVLTSLRPTWAQEIANQYNTTAAAVYMEHNEWIGCEGFTGDGHECQTFGEWMNRRFHASFKIEEPFQKGDLNYGL